MKTTSSQPITEALITAGSLESVHQHQHEIAETQQTIKKLSQAINVQDEVIETAQATIPKFPDRTPQREKLMAEIALGTASEDALKALDKQIAEDEQTVKSASITAKPLIDKARTIRAGLNSMLDSAKEKLQQLENKSIAIRRQFLIQEAEKTAAEYVANAQNLKANYLRLRGLEILIKNQNGRSINGPTHKQLYIPIFALPQFDGLEHRTAGHGTFYSAAWDGCNYTFFPELAEQEKNALSKLGIQF